MTLAPNFEMVLYLAQATGACVVTDNKQRWMEIRRTLRKPTGWLGEELPALDVKISKESFVFPQLPDDIEALSGSRAFVEQRAVIRDAFKYLVKRQTAERRPNVEQGLAARFARVHCQTQTVLRKRVAHGTAARISCAFPTGGIQDHTVNRLLLMSNSDHHLPAVPMAFLIEPHSK